MLQALSSQIAEALADVYRAAGEWHHKPNIQVTQAVVCGRRLRQWDVPDDNDAPEVHDNYAWMSTLITRQESA